MKEILQRIDEISRRDFLKKSVTAAGLLASGTSGVGHGQEYVPQIENLVIKSNDGLAYILYYPDSKMMTLRIHDVESQDNKDQKIKLPVRIQAGSRRFSGKTDASRIGNFLFLDISSISDAVLNSNSITVEVNLNNKGHLFHFLNKLPNN